MYLSPLLRRAASSKCGGGNPKQQQQQQQQQRRRHQHPPLRLQPSQRPSLTEAVGYKRLQTRERLAALQASDPAVRAVFDRIAAAGSSPCPGGPSSAGGGGSITEGCITQGDWNRMLVDHLHMDLSEVELARLWARVTAEEEGGGAGDASVREPRAAATLSFKQFQTGLLKMAFLRSAVGLIDGEDLSAAGGVSEVRAGDGGGGGFVVPAHYDFSLSTNENYEEEQQQQQQQQQQLEQQQGGDEGGGDAAAAATTTAAPAPAAEAPCATAAPPAPVFHGEFQHLRAPLDYGYHARYSRRRQLWQDRAIKATIVRTSPVPNPWLIFTCGPMGAGKGHTLNWMSRNGYFPLERIVHIDADHFKHVMPEWDGYVARDPARAGSHCHRESGLLAELAQAAAMDAQQNVWVDGSLRDGEWWARQIRKVRARYPQYRLAILVVTAEEVTVRRRAAARALQTGRAIPEDILVDSLRSVASSLHALTPLVHFVARIRNETEPELVAYEQVDASGRWDRLRFHFAQDGAAVQPGDFPRQLAPMVVCAGSPASDRRGQQQQQQQEEPPLLVVVDGSEDDKEARAEEEGNGERKAPWNSAEALQRGAALRAKFVPPPAASARLRDAALLAALTRRDLVLSPAHPVNLSTEARALAGVPGCAHSFAFCYPSMHLDWAALASGGSSSGGGGGTAADAEEVADDSSQLAMLLRVGAFVYFDVRGRVCKVNPLASVGFDAQAHSEAAGAAATGRRVQMLQFGPPEALPAAAVLGLQEQGRLCPVTLAALLHKGARYFAWIKPGEILPGMRPALEEGASPTQDAALPAPYGAFAYVWGDDNGVPVATDADVFFPITT